MCACGGGVCIASEWDLRTRYTCSSWHRQTPGQRDLVQRARWRQADRLTLTCVHTRHSIRWKNAITAAAAYPSVCSGDERRRHCSRVLVALVSAALWSVEPGNSCWEWLKEAEMACGQLKCAAAAVFLRGLRPCWKHGGACCAFDGSPSVEDFKKKTSVKGGKAGVEINTEKRDQRHISGPSKNRTIIRRKAQQRSLLMEKLPLQASGSIAGDVVPQIPKMFKQPLRVQTAPPPSF
ncbi:hypothetical protein NDU88_003969 [Pleurodeles waltl]|uniref:Uncharacterized protein n=1 Tax=Pleurodeles waltl TaxID=8319 RepID=A0AAV7W731_PLEWA|nr:hypothetical protein NDU88_003969 [Pleurodeles waltl]